MADELKVSVSVLLDADEQKSTERLKSQAAAIESNLQKQNTTIKIPLRLASTKISQSQLNTLITDAFGKDFKLMLPVSIDLTNLSKLSGKLKAPDGVSVKIPVTLDLSTIAGQIPNVQQKVQSVVSATGGAKVQVALDQSAVEKQAQQIPQKVENAVKSHEIGVYLNLEPESVEKLRAAMNNLGVNQDIQNAMASQLDSMGIQIDKISGKWARIRSEIDGVEAEEENLLNLTIQGTDQLGRSVDYLGRYNTETGNISFTITKVTENLEQQRRLDESRTVYLQRQQSILQDIYSNYTTNRPLTDTSHIEETNQKYETLKNKITELMQTEGELDSLTRATLQSQIADLRRVILEYQNLEAASAKATAKEKADIDARVTAAQRLSDALDKVQASYAVGGTSAKPVTDTEHLAALEAQYDKVLGSILSFMDAQGAVSKQELTNIQSQISALRLLSNEYKNAEYVANQLRTKNVEGLKVDESGNIDRLEEKLRNAGILTDDFKQKISDLRSSLSAAFDRTTLTAFLGEFDKLKAEISTTQEKIKGINALQVQIRANENQMTAVRSEMSTLDPSKDKERLVVLQQQLDAYRAQHLKLQEQLDTYGSLVQYAKQTDTVEQQRVQNELKLQYTEAELADKARQIKDELASIRSSGDALETRFRLINEPAQSLVDKMQRLRTLMAQDTSSMSNADLISYYTKVKDTIASCSREITDLGKVQRSGVNDSRLMSNLEKAKADLNTIGRTWSALKNNAGLNQQFQTLSNNLARIDNQADLNKWTAQFNAFKSEVKAAGANVQSFGDVLKTNLGKVMQWFTATTMIFRAFRTLKSAITTVIDLDTAMIDLRKTTQATEEEYKRFYESANDTAKALNVTTEAVISQTATWSRLGYTLQEAAELAKNSSIFAAVSPGMDIDKATEGLVSTIKAFGLDVSDTMDGIISKVNSVGECIA